MRKTLRRKRTDIVQPRLRLREDLRRKLEREAARKKHSLNAEMVHRLEMSFTTDLVERLTEGITELERARFPSAKFPSVDATGGITLWDELGNQWIIFRSGKRRTPSTGDETDGEEPHSGSLEEDSSKPLSGSIERHLRAPRGGSIETDKPNIVDRPSTVSETKEEGE
jgi:hypothetical protein